MADTITAINWIYDDGGYSESGFRAKHGNGVIIAIAIVTGAGYRKIYDDISTRQYRFVRNTRSKRIEEKGGAISEVGVWPQVTKAYLQEIEWEWTPTMSVGSGCVMHMSYEELPDEPVMLLSISRSLAAIQHGNVHAPWDPSRDGTRCVYGVWTPPRS